MKKKDQPSVEHIPVERDDSAKDKTDPPESTFVKLAPNENRYTILHKDELWCLFMQYLLCFANVVRWENNNIQR